MVLGLGDLLDEVAESFPEPGEEEIEDDVIRFSVNW